MPTIVVLLIMNSGWIFSSNLEQFFLFTNPTNWSTMEVFDMYIYKFGLKQLNYSYATAVGIIKSLVSIALLMGVNTVAKRVNGKSIL
jgi:putative aldouronate transport system permease protein